jgi:hypothetical protein
LKWSNCKRSILYLNQIKFLGVRRSIPNLNQNILISSWTYYRNSRIFLFECIKHIPLKLAQHLIKLDTSMPPKHQIKCHMNPNYAIIVKWDIINYLLLGLFNLLKKLFGYHWLWLCQKKTGKLWICVDFWKLNVAMKKYPYPLPFINEILNMTIWHEVY